VNLAIFAKGLLQHWWGISIAGCGRDGTGR